MLLSDDKEYGTLRVPLKAQYNGTPALVATPAALDFGFREASGANGAPKQDGPGSLSLHCPARTGMPRTAMPLPGMEPGATPRR